MLELTPEEFKAASQDPATFSKALKAYSYALMAILTEQGYVSPKGIMKQFDIIEDLVKEATGSDDTSSSVRKSMESAAKKIDMIENMDVFGDMSKN